MQLACEESLRTAGGRHEEVQSVEGSVGVVRSPDGSEGVLAVQRVPAGGWCFFDAFLAHLPGAMAAGVDRRTLAAAVLHNLAAYKEGMLDLLVSDGPESLRRQSAVLDIPVYALHIDLLEPFHYYVLDKLESVMVGGASLPDRCWADFPEIRAWLYQCETSAFFFAVGETETSGRLLTYDGMQEHSRDLHELFHASEFELAFVHYDVGAFQHYDAVTFVTGEPWACSAGTTARVLSLVRESVVAEAVAADDKDAARAAMLLTLGVQRDDGTTPVDADKASGNDEVPLGAGEEGPHADARHTATRRSTS